MTLRPTIERAAKKIIAFLPMYACYYLGELAFQIVNRWPEGWSEENTFMDRLGTCIYRLYSWGTLTSADLNDWAGFKLWYVDEEEKAKDSV